MVFRAQHYEMRGFNVSNGISCLHAAFLSWVPSTSIAVSTMRTFCAPTLALVDTQEPRRIVSPSPGVMCERPRRSLKTSVQWEPYLNSSTYCYVWRNV